MWKLILLDASSEGASVEWFAEMVELYIINPSCILGYVVLVTIWIWRLGKNLQKSWAARKEKKKVNLDKI